MVQGLGFGVQGYIRVWGYSIGVKVRLGFRVWGFWLFERLWK